MYLQNMKNAQIPTMNLFRNLIRNNSLAIFVQFSQHGMEERQNDERHSERYGRSFKPRHQTESNLCLLQIQFSLLLIHNILTRRDHR